MAGHLLLGMAVASGRAVVTVLPAAADAPTTASAFALIDRSLNVGLAASVADELTSWAQDWISAGVGVEADAAFIGAGLSVGGHIDSHGGEVVYAQDVVVDGEHWEHEQMRAALQDCLGIPVQVENDANCMAELYRQTSFRSAVDNFVTVYLAPEAHGLGCGIVVAGELVRGASGGAGELGHVVVQPNGPRCHCGNRGCLAAVVSGSSIVRDVNWGGVRDVPAASLVDASALVELGDKRASGAFVRAGQLFGQGLAAVVNLLNPRTLVVGGPPELIPREGAQAQSAIAFVAAARKKLSEFAYSSFSRDCELVLQEFDLRDAAAGAALIARRRLTAGQGR